LGIGSPSFDFSVKINCEHVRFRKLTKFSRPVSAVVFSFPGPVGRLAAVFDVARHPLLALNRGLDGIVRWEQSIPRNLEVQQLFSK
jgi:hypothetical protein